MKILSVHSHSHDSTVTYIEGNDVKYILSSERLSRIKNDDGFPALAFKKLLFDCDDKLWNEVLKSLCHLL